MRYRKKFFAVRVVRLGQVVQINCFCLVPGSVSSQIGWGFEHHGLVRGVPACDRAVGLDGLQWSFQTM